MLFSVSFLLNFRASKDDKDREVTEICETFNASTPRILSNFVNDTAYAAHCSIYNNLNDKIGRKS